MDQKSTARDRITDGVIWKEMLIFFLPIMAGALLQQVYNTTDAIIIGRALGKEALASVGGSSGKIIALLVNFFVSLTSGASIIISQHFGAGNKQEVKKSIYTGVVLSVICGLLVMIVGLLAIYPLLHLLQTTPETMESSAAYLRVYFLGVIPTLIYNMGSSILRAMGDAKRPLYFLFVSLLLNIGLTALFVLVIPWGVEGAAGATVLSQILCTVLVMITLLKLPSDIALVPRKELFDGNILRSMLKIGLPTAVQGSMYSISNAVTQTAINSLGTNSMAAWTAYGKIDDFFWPTSQANGIAIMTFIGQNYGAGKMDRVREIIRQGTYVNLAIAAFFSVFITLARYPLIELFVGNDPAVIEIGTTLVLTIIPLYITYSPTAVLSATMRGVGNTFKPMLITMAFTCFFRLVYLQIYGFSNLTNTSLALVYPLSWALTSIAFILYYKFGKWMPTEQKL